VRPLSGDVTFTFDFGFTHTLELLTDDTERSFIGIAGTINLNVVLDKAMRAGFVATINVSLADTDIWTSRIALSIESKLADNLSAGLLAEMFYNNAPVAGLNNTDFRLLFTLGVTV